jgi:hypothetical protein
MKECLAKIPRRTWKIVVRADSAFFNGAFLDYLESNNIFYCIKVKLKNLEALLSQQKWKKIPNNPRFEYTTFDYRCNGWKKSRRLVAVRKIIGVKNNISKNLMLFNDKEIEYKYFCYVQNMDFTPWKAHKFYGKRATCENWIEWCKTQMSAGSILVNKFWANSALFQTCILGYNLMVWMMWLNDKKGFKEEPNTIRMILINVPARLKYIGRQWFLRLDQYYPFRDRWKELESSIASLSFA